MQYMFLIYGDEKAYESLSPAAMADVMKAFGAYTDALLAAGVLRGGSELAPVRSATTVRVRSNSLRVTDGPVADAREQLDGYYLVDCASLDDAIAWASKCPGAEFGAVEIHALVPDAAGAG
jgi:hypothetical protein